MRQQLLWGFLLRLQLLAETPVTPAQPTTAPVKPENKPNKTKDNGKTVKPHAENATNRHGRKYAPAVAIKNTTKPQGTVLNNTQTKQHPQAIAKPQGVVSANKKQNQKTLPQTGAKKLGKISPNFFSCSKSLNSSLLLNTRCRRLYMYRIQDVVFYGKIDS